MKTTISILLFVCVCVFTNAQASTKAIKVEVTGTGSPVLFIAGFTVPGAIWQPQVNELKSSYECHVVSIAGFGGLEPVEFPWLPKVNEAIANYIKVNNLQNLTIVGHSLGGTIGIWLASQPELNVKKLIIVDALPATGALMFPDFKPENLSYDNPYSDQQLAMSDANFKQMATGMSQGMSVNPDARQQIASWILEAHRKTYVYGYTDYLKLDVRENLKNITAPVTILAATQPYGEETIRKTLATQYENLKNYKLEVATGAAHFIMLDDPKWFNEKLMQELRAHD